MAWPQTVRKTDLRIDFYRGTGKGGQNKNKRDTACRITHIPTGIAVTAEEHRTQGKNKEAAFNRLTKKLVPLMRAAAKQPIISMQNEFERIRTYNEKGNLVTDHRTGKSAPMDEVLNGKIDKLQEVA